MTSKACFIKTANGLVPLDDDGREIMAALKADKKVMVHVHAARNPDHHRLLFAMFKKLRDGGVWSGDKDSLIDYIKYGTGHVRSVIDHKGQAHIVPKSISFESMDQVAFNRFFDRACWLICHRLLQRDDWQSLRDELIEMMDGPLTLKQARAA